MTGAVFASVVCGALHSWALAGVALGGLTALAFGHLWRTKRLRRRLETPRIFIAGGHVKARFRHLHPKVLRDMMPSTRAD